MYTSRERSVGSRYLPFFPYPYSTATVPDAILVFSLLSATTETIYA